MNGRVEGMAAAGRQMTVEERLQVVERGLLEIVQERMDREARSLVPASVPGGGLRATPKDRLDTGEIAKPSGAPTSQSQVEVSVGRIQSAIERLEHLQETLEVKLRPVVYPVPTAQPCSTGTDFVPLADTLSVFARRIDVVNDMLIGLVSERIQL